MTRTFHASLVIVDGVGALITGEAGSGKSECALSLITRGHSLVSDDVVLIARTDNALNGRAPDNFAGLLEIRDIGIIDVKQAFGRNSFAAQSKIDLCVEFRKSDSGGSRARIGNDRSAIEILGIKLPYFSLTVDANRNLAVLVELSAKLGRIDAKAAERDLISKHDLAVTGKRSAV